MRAPSGLNAALLTAPVCPCSAARQLAGYRVPHSRGVVREAVTMRAPSGLNAALLTQPACPCSAAS